MSVSTATTAAHRPATKPAPLDVPPPVEHDPELLVRSLADWTDVAPVEADDTPLPPRTIALGLAGYLALPVVGLLDAGGGPGILPSAIAPPVAALLLSVPSLVVGHQYLGLSASPRDLLSDVGRVFVQTGRLALGLVPAVGLYAATTGLGSAALIVSLLVIGVLGLELARRRLIRRERAAAVPSTPPTPAQRLRMVGLATAWATLALLIAARLGHTFVYSL